MDSPPHKQARCTISTMSPNSKPRRRESAQTKLWLLPGDHLPHHPRRHRSQQNSISKMSGRNKISRNRRRAQNGQPVGRSRTQPRPSFQNPPPPPIGEPNHPPPAAASGSSPASSAYRIPLPRPSRRSPCAHRSAESDKPLEPAPHAAPFPFPA